MRVSVTDLDAFRSWRYSEDGSLDELLARLRREEPPTEQMLAGSALHAALEHAEAGEVTTLDRDGFTFHIEADVSLALPELREIKAEKVYVVDGLPVVVVGKVDTLYGNTVDDHKTTSHFDAERFLDTYQWRFYLDIFDADRFRWNVFEMAEGAEPRTYRVFGFHQLDQYRYVGMHEDCMDLLREFVAFARTHMPELITGLPAKSRLEQKLEESLAMAQSARKAA